MKYCSNCGAELKEGAQVCLNCGVIVDEKVKEMEEKETNQKSKLIAGLLALFLGSLGIHNFYLGNTNKGIAQLCLTIFGWIICVGPIIAEIWAFVEAIMIFTGSISTDATGNQLKD